MFLIYDVNVSKDLFSDGFDLSHTNLPLESVGSVRQ